MTSFDAGRRLATELRRLAAHVHAHEVDDAALAGLADVVATAREALDGPSSVDRRERGLFRGARNPLAPPMLVETAEGATGRAESVGRVTLNRLYEGPPGGVHGGFLAGLFDDVLGGAQRFVEGLPAVTGRLTVRYRAMAPLDTDLELRGWVHSARGRRIVARGTCHAGETLVADAEALFVRVSQWSEQP